MGMLHSQWWQQVQQDSPFLLLSQGGESGFNRIFINKPWQERIMLKGIKQLQQLRNTFQNEQLRTMDLIDLEQALCEYTKFCREVELQGRHISIVTK